MAAKEAELAAKDSQLSASLREAAEINEEYISELTTTQQQLESEVATLTAQLDAASSAAGQRERQDADLQAAHKRLRGQVGTVGCHIESIWQIQQLKISMLCLRVCGNTCNAVMPPCLCRGTWRWVFCSAV